MMKLKDGLDVHAEMIVERMREGQERLLAERGLRMSNRQTKELKRDVEAWKPRETRKAAAFRRYSNRKLGKMGAASKVRHIDPTTGRERTKSARPPRCEEV